MVMVRLTPQEMDECIRAGKHRFYSSRDAKIVNQLQCQHTHEESPVRDIQGIKAEFAVAKLFNIKLNTFQLGADNGIDLWIDDFSVDVKATAYKPDGKNQPHFLIMNTKTLKADIGILGIIGEEEDANEVDVFGWTTKAIWEKEKKPWPMNPKDNCLEAWRLLAIHKLWESQMKKRFNK